MAMLYNECIQFLANKRGESGLLVSSFTYDIINLINQMIYFKK